MTKLRARICAKLFSKEYLTFWFVREVKPGIFEPWAHSTNDERTVATFYCGKEWTGE